MNKNVALIGNPNSGKTSLFNILTGMYQKVGNWSGVTVEKKEGLYRRNKQVKITDLPGLYSLDAFSKDEKAVTDFLKSSPPEVIINVVDGTKLERSLNLTALLSELKIPVVIALNMADELRKNGIKPDIKKLSRTFGMPVICISALKGENVDELMSVALSHDVKPENAAWSAMSPSERFLKLGKIADEVIHKKQTRSERLTERLDDIITHRFFGIPLFIAVMFAVYFISLSLGGGVSRTIERGFDNLSAFLSANFVKMGLPDWFVSLVSEGVICGIGTVMGFLPQILVLFFMLTLLEESGYMARVAFILDRFFRLFGLGGKSCIPMVLSCGCTVTGLMSTRTIENRSEREMTVYLSPFMPCGAKTAVFGWFSYKFFGGSALVAVSMYFIGIISAAVFGAILKKTKGFSDGEECFLIEMPTFRFPSFKNVFYVLLMKIKEFLVKAGTVIFAVSVLTWFLMNFGFKGYTSGKVEDSILYNIGSILKYIFVPLGFGNWQASVAVLSGFMAKEAVIETLELICVDAGSLFDNAFSVYAFMTFVLLSPPCAASVIQAKKELKSGKKLIKMLVFQTCAGYAAALAVNTAGLIYYSSFNLIFILISVIIILSALAFSLRKILKGERCCCARCTAGGGKCRKSRKHNTTL